MSQFNYNQYSQFSENARNNGTQNSNQKIGFFKLKNNGDEALVRINASKMEDFAFASVHTVNANGRWMKVSCLNPLGSYGHNCPLCEAVKNGNTSISKVSTKIYIPMLVAYRDVTTGQFSAPIPVIWERPASFGKEIANKLRDYGDLKNVLLKITRNGAAGDMKTTYSMDYAVPTVFKPELVPADFSAFNNFNIAKHSYWEKTTEDIMTFITTGKFPEVVKQNTTETAPTITTPMVEQVYTAPVNTTPYTPVQGQNTPVQSSQYVAPQTPVTPVQPVQQPVVETPTQAVVEDRPVRNFNGWSF